MILQVLGEHVKTMCVGSAGRKVVTSLVSIEIPVWWHRQNAVRNESQKQAEAAFGSVSITDFSTYGKLMNGPHASHAMATLSVKSPLAWRDEMSVA